MARERFQFHDTGTRDLFFQKLVTLGYTVTKYRPGDVCSGRIVAGDGGTTRYEVVGGQMILYADATLDDTIVVLAKQSGGQPF